MAGGSGAESAKLDRSAKWLHLFAGNSRRLYMQGILNVLAAPNGYQHFMRYESSLVPKELKEDWGNNTLVGCNVAIYHAILQEYAYHPAAFLPIRTGTVVETSTVGRTHTVVIQVGEYFAPASGANDRSEMSDVIRNLSDALRRSLGADPDRGAYAVMAGPPPPELIEFEGSAQELWERSLNYLRHTISFRDAVFWRVAAVRELGKSTGNLVRVDDGRFVLAAGRGYALQLVQFQARQQTEQNAADLSITVPPELLQVAGRDSARIETEYDAMTFRLFVSPRDNPTEAVVVVETQAPVLGPVLQLPVRIVTAAATTALLSLVAVVGLTLTAMPAILGNTTPMGVRITVALLGAGLATSAVFGRRYIGLGRG